MIYLICGIILGGIYYKREYILKTIHNMNKGKCSVIKKTKGVYEINCNIENKDCKILIKIRRGPFNKIIYDNNNNDITSLVKKFNNYIYLGFVPKYYGYESVNMVDTN